MRPVPPPHQVMAEVRESLLAYVDTAYWLRDPQLIAERRQLLSEPGVLFQEPLLEPVLPYPGTDPAHEVCRAVGLTDPEADLLLRSVFGDVATSDMRLRAHQAAALRTSMIGLDGATNPVVTSGTGSGKTESFLLPVLARLIVESRDWTAEPPLEAVVGRRVPSAGPPPERLGGRPPPGPSCSTP